MPKDILIIDDEAAIRALLKRMLEQEGYSVREASNGQVGIEMYHESVPDLVITDLIMPEKEGIETIRDLRRDNPHLPIIAMSGGGAIDPQEYLFMAERLGVRQTIQKPFQKETIISAVKHIFGESL